ncbi:MAG: metalloregulator ArsR/SmtB family transcription factor [Gammaproteobacteria bacterium]|nr:metalloregulator ArsR/SmtB family transcription factor [Gammaproteobacteria bacterium]
MPFNTEIFFASLSHPLRLRVVMLLTRAEELCVCELTQTLNVSQPVLSKQLAQLKNAGILASRRQGVWMYYHINNKLPEWAINTLSNTFNGIGQSSPYLDDYHLFQSSNQSECC